jgi:hypothetical protein
MLKLLNPTEIQLYFNLNPDKSYNNMIDQWIYLSPCSDHIVQALTLLVDYNHQVWTLTEFCKDHNNLYEII